MNSEIKQRIEQIKNGEVPDGYIKKYKYVFPDTWKLVSLGSVTKRKSEKNKDRNDLKSYSINNQVGFIQQDEQFSEGSYQDVDKTNYKVVKPGEFAYNPARVNIGSIGLQKEDMDIIISSLYVCFGLDKSCSKTYFENWFKSYDFNKEITRNLEGSVREYLFYENFSNIKLPIPSLAEQQKIAEILMQCDKVIELKQKRIEEEKKIKRWLMENLLKHNGDVRIRGFSDKWQVEPLSNKVKYIKNGYVYDALHQGGTCKVTRIETISNGTINPNAVSVIEPRDDIEQYRLAKNDILYSHINSFEQLGKCAMYDGEEELYHGMNLLCIRVNFQKCSPHFLYYLLKSAHGKKMVNKYAKRAIGQCSISAKEIMQHKFPFPNTIEEQLAIAGILMKQDDKINLLEEELFQWQQKKKSLMQLLLTGIVRVDV